MLDESAGGRTTACRSPSTGCPCCGGQELSRIDTDATRALDVVPGSYSSLSMSAGKQPQCFDTISQVLALSHAVPHDIARPGLACDILGDRKSWQIKPRLRPLIKEDS